MIAAGMPPTIAFVAAIDDPAQCTRWTLAEWELAVRQARRLRLLARLAYRLDDVGLLDAVPPAPRRHLKAEMQLSDWRTRALTWTAERVAAALQPLGAPMVLLKGAAYIAQGLSIARGRLPSDLDILVPRPSLVDAQRLLAQAGWEEVELDEHDRRYYLEWSHELPPMQHPVLTVELDVHHNILPDMSRSRVDADALLSRLKASGWAPWAVLDPIDQLLHSAAHLFLDAEPRDRVRDLVDLDGLVRQFGGDAAFWAELPHRAEALGLLEPAALALRFVAGWFGTPIAPEAQALVLGVDTRWRSRNAAWLMERVLVPGWPDSEARSSQTLASQLLWLRYQVGRLPPRALIRHAAHRLWPARRGGARDGSAAADEGEPPQDDGPVP